MPLLFVGLMKIRLMSGHATIQWCNRNGMLLLNIWKSGYWYGTEYQQWKWHSWQASISGPQTHWEQRKMMKCTLYSTDNPYFPVKWTPFGKNMTVIFYMAQIMKYRQAPDIVLVHQLWEIALDLWEQWTSPECHIGTIFGNTTAVCSEWSQRSNNLVWEDWALFSGLTLQQWKAQGGRTAEMNDYMNL